MLGVQQRGRFHGLQDFAHREIRFGAGGVVGQLDDDALDGAGTKGNPYQLAGLRREAGGDGVGKGAGVAHRGVYRYVRIPQSSHKSAVSPGGG